MLRIVEEGDEGSKQVEEGDEGRRMCGGMYYDRCSGVMSAVGLLQRPDLFSGQVSVKHVT
jgi:hypothetical protein